MIHKPLKRHYSTLCDFLFFYFFVCILISFPKTEYKKPFLILGELEFNGLF